jgi:hypothetical protein
MRLLLLFLAAANVAHASTRVDPALLRAIPIAEHYAHRHSTGWCWHYVKVALLKAGAVQSYPKTNYAKQAVTELTRSYGFVELRNVKTPTAAPVGAVLVYGAKGAGHVELRAPNGFVSDYFSKRPPPRMPLVAVLVKLT